MNQTDDFLGLLDYDLISTATKQYASTHKIFSDRQFSLALVVDIRGTFSSNPLNVSLNALARIIDPWSISDLLALLQPLTSYCHSPTNQQEYDTFRAAAATVFKSWIDNRHNMPLCSLI